MIPIPFVSKPTGVMQDEGEPPLLGRCLCFLVLKGCLFLSEGQCANSGSLIGALWGSVKGSWDHTPRCGKPSCSLTSSSSFNPTIPGSILQRPFPPSVVCLEEIARFSSQATCWGPLHTRESPLSLQWKCSSSTLLSDPLALV